MLKKLAAVALLGIMSIQAENRVFEMRTYVAKEGKLENLLARFRDHTTRLFEKHGMENVAYWVAADAPASQTTLIYVLAHKSREAATASWDAFRKDPEWMKARTASEANGAIVDKVTSVFMTPTDFSKMK
ncbi:MAG TPA: NIPSNAP family protein [Bryobacteraceae bacterium]|nr:NIPSNAP family protein [Bryobacteraceae bacterium]